MSSLSPVFARKSPPRCYVHFVKNNKLESGVEINLLRSTLFGKNSTLLRSTLLKMIVFDKIENIILLKRVFVREIEKSTLLKN